MGLEVFRCYLLYSYEGEQVLKYDLFITQKRNDLKFAFIKEL